MSDLEELKKVIRSLLVSSPLKVTAASLNRDYKEIEGTDIPYKDFKHTSLISLLQSMPDVLKLQGTTLQSEISMVVSPKIVHVNNMVMKQKKPKTGRKSTLPRKSVTNNNSSIYANNRNKGPSNIAFRNAFSAYQNTHPKSMVNWQTNSSIMLNLNSNYLNAQILTQTRVTNTNSPFQSLSPFPRPILPTSTRATYFRNCIFPKQLVNFQNNNLITPNNTYKEEKNESQRESVNEMNELHTSQSKDTITFKSSNIKSDFKAEESNVNLVHIEMADLKKNALENNIESKFAKLKILANRRSNNNKNNNSSTSDKKVENGLVNASNIRNGSVYTIPKDIQNNLRDLIAHKRDGLWCNELPLEYAKLYGDTINYEKYGFASLAKFCLALDNIFYCEELPHKLKLYNKKHPLSRIHMIKYDERVSPIDPYNIRPLKTEVWNTYSYLIPKDVVVLGETIEYKIIDNFALGDNIPVSISALCNPGEFWFTKNDKSLENMMISLNLFYQENKQNYIIPHILVEIGLYCVVLTKNKFKRGIVIDLLSELGGFVKIFFMDYGYTSDILISNIWFLSKSFTESPQAVKAYLENIEPAEKNIWMIHSISRFNNFINDENLLAQISSKNDNAIGVYIFSRSTPLKSLNEILVNERYAKYVSQKKIFDDTSQGIKNNKMQKLLAIVKKRRQKENGISVENNMENV